MIDAYYDFRSPYAYFANYRIRQGSIRAAAAGHMALAPCLH
jgi:2-hydroxychromene-2-carboxylate isomerase